MVVSVYYLRNSEEVYSLVEGDQKASSAQAEAEGGHSIGCAQGVCTLNIYPKRSVQANSRKSLGPANDETGGKAANLSVTYPAGNLSTEAVESFDLSGVIRSPVDNVEEEAVAGGNVKRSGSGGKARSILTQPFPCLSSSSISQENNAAVATKELRGQGFLRTVVGTVTLLYGDLKISASSCSAQNCGVLPTLSISFEAVRHEVLFRPLSFEGQTAPLESSFLSLFDQPKENGESRSHSLGSGLGLRGIEVRQTDSPHYINLGMRVLEQEESTEEMKDKKVVHFVLGVIPVGVGFLQLPTLEIDYVPSAMSSSSSYDTARVEAVGELGQFLVLPTLVDDLVLPTAAHGSSDGDSIDSGGVLLKFERQFFCVREEILT